MHPVDEIPPPTLRFNLLLVLLVVLDELFLLVAFGLEEEAGGLVEGAAQPHQEFAGAGEGEGLVEGVREEGLRLGRTAEASLGHLVFETPLLCSGQVAAVAPVVQSRAAHKPLFLWSLTQLRMVRTLRPSREATSSSERPSASQSKADKR